MRATISIFLLLTALSASAQQTKPWERKPCKEHQGWCGIIVTFEPPLKDELVVPNEVTVDVPLELTPSRVVVSSYPLGTEVGDIPSQDFVEMHSFEKVGKYARFRGEIKKCTDQGSLEVEVYSKGFESYPINAGVGGAIECRQADPSDTGHPPPTK